MEPGQYNNGYGMTNNQGMQYTSGNAPSGYGAGGSMGSATSDIGGGASQLLSDNHNRGTIIVMAVLAVLAVGGIVFGTGMLIAKNAAMEELSRQTTTNGVAGNGGIASDNGAVNARDYIYIGEWGIKIRITDRISYLRYNYRTFADRSVLGVSGASTEVASEPSFVGAAESLGGIGRVIRVANSYGYAYGKFIFTNGGYDYYYEPLNYVDFVEAGEVELEAEAARLIEEMLTNPENYSLIAS